MIKKTILAALLWLPLSLMAQNGFVLNGQIDSLKKTAMAQLRYYNEGREIKDSVLLYKGRFTFRGQLTAPVLAELSLNHDTANIGSDRWGDVLQLYLENSTIDVKGTDFISRAVVTGSATSDDNKKLASWRRPYRKMADSLTRLYKSWTPEQRKDSALVAGLRPIMQVSQLGYDSVSRAFIANHPNSHISLVAFKQVELPFYFNPDTAAIKFARFPEKLRTSPLGKEIAASIEKSKQTNIGVTAMDFTELDPAGNSVKLSDFRGKYVLLDFWASWCTPCRAENPNMLKAYNMYKNKNFTILGVSVDDSDGRGAWLAAIKKDGIPWTQVSELKGVQAKSALLYGVTAIPMNFLIDPTGKIIARNLRGEELHLKLSQLFPSK